MATATLEQRREVRVYSVGACFASVCVPKDLAVEIVESAVDLSHPTGLDHGWKIAHDGFASGDPNPCPCNEHPDERVHRLLVC